MGKASRPRPERLAEKLLQIRTVLDLTQSGMIVRMGMTDTLVREEISLFERGIREPPLPVLLEYARTANVYVDALIDDGIDLPARLPSGTKSEGVRRPYKSRKGQKR